MQINRNENGEEGRAGHFGGQGNLAAGHFQSAWRIMKAPALVMDYLIVHELIHLLETNHALRFWNIRSDEFPPTQAEPFSTGLSLLHHERELPHDDFRRPHYDFQMSFISRALAPSAFRKNTSGGGEEGDNAG